MLCRMQRRRRSVLFGIGARLQLVEEDDEGVTTARAHGRHGVEHLVVVQRHLALLPRGIFVDASFRRICRAIITESEGSSHAGGITALFIDAARAARATLPAIKIKQPPCIAVR